MGKLEERENRRKAVVGSMIERTEVSSAGRGRPKKERELKKRISLSVLPSLYENIQKIAYVQRRSTSELMAEIMNQYKEEHENELIEYKKIRTD